MRALGAGHSFSAVAGATDDVVLLDSLPRAMDIDTTGSTAVIAASMRYADVVHGLDAAGFALPNLASLQGISVVGACATGTHGSGDDLRCLSASVVALQVVSPGGDLVGVRRDTDGDLFAGCVVALGALGVVTELTLQLEPAFDVAQVMYVDVSLEEVVADFDAIFGSAYSVSVFTDWHSGLANVLLKHRVGRSEAGWAGSSPAQRSVHPVHGLPPDSCTEQLGVVGPWHERLPHFRMGHRTDVGDELQSEFYLPRHAAPDAIAAIRRLADRLAPVLKVSELRTVRSDDLWLSPAYGRDSVTVHFTWVKDVAAAMPVLTAVEQQLAELGSRPHWAKLSTLPPSDIFACYERADDFRALADQIDPTGKFRNSFVDTLLSAT